LIVSAGFDEQTTLACAFSPKVPKLPIIGTSTRRWLSRTMPDFKNAAKKHFKDAELLFGKERFDNADHLFGVSAECAIKALLIHFGVGTDRHTGDIHGYRQHVNELWPRASLYFSGRTGARFASYFSQPSRPFDNWRVKDRYEAEGAIRRETVDNHRKEAKRINSMMGAYLQ